MAKTTKKYYKVTSYDLSSARAPYFCVIRYKLNEYVSTKDNTRLFVFDNLHEAVAFRHGNERIFECKVIGGIKHSGCFSFHFHNYWKLFNSFLRKKKKQDWSKYNNEFSPVNAVLVKSVKLIKEIHNK